ncbi:MAG: lysophospholipid acyltransferase family protein [Thermoanaerobaculales bacterium]|nr:lysophospholipid acyltransferase family protein [Thermoanaerobaculales bacterium]
MRRRRSALRNRVEFSLYRLARTAARALSPAASARLGGAIGGLFYRLSRRRREIIDFNLALALPELGPDRRRELALAVSRHFGRVSLDAIRIQGLSPEGLRAEVTVEGEAHLRAAVDGGRGFFLLSAHLGSWEVAALVGGLLVPGGMSVIHRPLDNPLLDAELERLRATFGNRALGKANVSREVMQTVRAGGAVGILIDQRPHGVDFSAPFFGHPAVTHPVLARFVRRTGAPVVPIFGYWDAPARYTVVFGEPIDPAGLEPDELEDLPLTTRFNRVIEAAIRHRPEQWLWYHDRWRQLRLPGKAT